MLFTDIKYKALSGKTDELKRYLEDGTELVFGIVDDAGDGVSYTRRIGNAATDGLY